MTAPSIAIVTIDSRSEIGTCNGPASDGSCPRAETGAAVPCAGLAIAPAGARAAGPPIAVPRGETRCPVTGAWALFLGPDILPSVDE